MAKCVETIEPGVVLESGPVSGLPVLNTVGGGKNLPFINALFDQVTPGERTAFWFYLMRRPAGSGECCEFILLLTSIEQI